MSEHQTTTYEVKKTFLDGVQPKIAFFLGVASALSVVFTVGFFISLTLLLKQINGGNNVNAVANAAPIQQPTAQAQAAPQNIVLADVTDKDWVRGDKNAPVTIVEFSDIDCPFCTQFHETMKQVMTDYPGKVKWVYRHFPLRNLHPNAADRAEVAECIGEAGGNDKFWQALDIMFSAEGKGLDKEATITIASKIGVNEANVRNCVNSGKNKASVSAEENQAVAAGGRGTPYSVIVKGDIKAPMEGAFPITEVKQILDSILAQ
ncbi:MAG: thioredoxin domain-containing protein [Parcubacteria group bacterium]|nr:thioredoxin domain-containing protein [Parcubacteria group bacterium]